MFKPSSWEINAEPVNFQTTQRTKQSQKNAKNSEKNRISKRKTASKVEASVVTPEEICGRITKKKISRKSGQQKKVPTNLVQAAMDSMNVQKNTNIGTIKTETSANSSMLSRLKENLLGGRFRYLNEQLYTMESSQAVKLFIEEPEAFDAYHEGYRHQVKKWPLNPLERVIKCVRKLPKQFVIGDFGCGEGKLAQSVPHKVYSIDLVSRRDDIIASDMTRTPLEKQSLDVAVYCLSLMGTNLRDCLLEANRVLKMGGLVLVAEIQSRFDALQPFISGMRACGFDMMKKETIGKLFYLHQYKKVRAVNREAPVQQFSLKPCLYRHR